MKRVIIESPYGSKDPAIIERNVKYARFLLLMSYRRGEAPIASHLLGPQVLDDNDPIDRNDGMQAGWAWMRFADAMIVGCDFGITDGMKRAIERAEILEVPAEHYRHGFKTIDDIDMKHAYAYVYKPDAEVTLD